ncbi:hypothetical protein B0G76_7975 [Paraburkholderia sp. BL23I1N1]|nr:hypothetical protein B0G76_7975 [Paraburkholderia sp. BL23I1N1]
MLAVLAFPCFLSGLLASPLCGAALFFACGLSENQLRRSAFSSVPDLVSTIEQYVEKHNRDPKPFIWTAKASDILAKVTRARKKLNKMQSV